MQINSIFFYKIWCAMVKCDIKNVFVQLRASVDRACDRRRGDRTLLAYDATPTLEICSFFGFLLAFLAPSGCHIS